MPARLTTKPVTATSKSSLRCGVAARADSVEAVEKLSDYHLSRIIDRPLVTNCSPSFDSQALVTSASNNKFLMP
jgi:hypothetical protein